MTDTPILDPIALFGQWMLFALVVGCVVAAVRAVRSAYLAERSAANQAEWTATLPQCGLCGAHRLLTQTQVTFLDDINHHIRDAYTVCVCSDCLSAITSHERSAA